MPEIRAFRRLTDAVEHASVLDKAIDIDRSVVNALAKPKALRQLLHGVPFGHPLHPLLVQVPLGAWTSAAVLDLIGGKGKRARGEDPRRRGAPVVRLRIGGRLRRLVRARPCATPDGLGAPGGHWVGISLYGLSWMQRKRGNHGAGKLLGFAGLAVVGVGGYSADTSRTGSGPA
ncbi:hypothetical protein [Curtobacterium sp. B18]|uniref:hypothetical protein n=1 Tax=Curtobacterium sp. B18 TaxID=95614 RepID=UPI00034C736E|nr:hypothetical protein [Curtobacterium sp. B18]